MDHASKPRRRRRRRDRSRVKRRAAQAYPDWPAAIKAADHLCLCSCPGCGNPRHHAGSERERLTLQERRRIER